MTPTSPDRRQERLLLGAIAAAVLGAAFVPVWNVGVGWTVAAGAFMVVVALSRRAISVQFAPDRGWRRAAGTAAFALTTVAAVRAAPWLTALCLVAAFALTSYALVGGSGWAGMLRGFTALPKAAVIGARPVVRSMARKGLGRSAWGVTLALLCGVGLVAVFAALFSAADIRFSILVYRLALDGSNLLRFLIGFSLMVTLGLGAAYLLSRRAPSPPASPPRPRRRLRAAEWLIPLVMVDVLFGAFIATQLGGLFGGDSYVLSDGGPDYADHARNGFAQLGVVTLLTLAVVSILAGFAGRETRHERLLLRLFGGALCVMTLVVVASALNRIAVYASAYGFTIPRLIGAVGELWLGAVVVLVIAAGVRLRAAWLPRTVTALGVLMLLALAAANPDALMAQTHIEARRGEYPIDYEYLSNLSTDASRELDRLPEPERTCQRYFTAWELHYGPGPWHLLNLSRETTRARLVPSIDEYQRVCGDAKGWPELP